MDGRMRVGEMGKMGVKEKRSENSNEIIWELERIPPRKEYLELEDQPAKTIPYTPSDETANTQSTPTSTLATTIGWPNQVLPKGTTASAMIEGAIAHAGASQ